MHRQAVIGLLINHIIGARGAEAVAPSAGGSASRDMGTAIPINWLHWWRGIRLICASLPPLAVIRSLHSTDPSHAVGSPRTRYAADERDEIASRQPTPFRVSHHNFNL